MAIDVPIQLFKTKFVIFSKRQTSTEPILYLNITPIEKCNQGKYLVLIVDSQLAWSADIRNWSKNGDYNRKQELLDIRILLSLYRSHIRSGINYGPDINFSSNSLILKVSE